MSIGHAATLTLPGASLKITEIVFYNTNRAKLVVEIPETEAYMTHEVPRIPRILFKLFPHMATQRCYNDGGYSFRREAQATEIPHLFEHLIIEIQDQVRRGMGAPFAGETQWNWTVDPRGRFYVTVDYDNEIVALASIRLAERIINALDSKDIAQIDMAREITKLRELAKISRRFAANMNGREAQFADSPEPIVEEPAPAETPPPKNNRHNHAAPSKTAKELERAID
jgi:hypothetical protein